MHGLNIQFGIDPTMTIDEFDPVTTNWIFHVNSKNYVHKVFSDRNEREIE